MTRGLAEYRLGRFDAAASWLQKALAHGGASSETTTAARLVLAMAHQRRGQIDQAHKVFAAATSALDGLVPNVNDWDDWQLVETCRFLRREAEEQLKGAPAVTKD